MTATTLSAAKKALLEKWKQRAASRDGRLDVIPLRTSVGPAPLSHAQERLWFLQRLEPESAAYNIGLTVSISGRVNIRALEEAIAGIIGRHEILRTTFRLANGSPAQFVQSHRKGDVPLIDLTGLPIPIRESTAVSISAEQARIPFDLAEGPLVRQQLLRMAEDDHRLNFTMHHIVADGGSIGILESDFRSLYHCYDRGAPPSLAQLRIQYADYAAWHRQWLENVLAKQLSYWKRQLAGMPEMLELPTDKPRPSVRSDLGAEVDVSLSANTTEALKRLSRSQGVTLFMTLLAGFQHLLQRYTGQDDVVVGSPLANRRGEAEQLVGLFVNTVVLRTDLSGDPTVNELLARVKEVAVGAYENQDTPFEKLVHELRPERALSHTPLFQVMFALQNQPKGTGTGDGLQFVLMGTENPSTKFDLTLTLSETRSGLRGTLEYSKDLFERKTIERMARHLERLLNQMTERPDRHLSELEMLSDPEKAVILNDFNNTTVDFAKVECIHTLFEAQVQRTPDAIAVVAEEQELSYAELNGRANDLARKLVENGIGKGCYVPVLMNASGPLVVALIAVLKAGAAFVPVDTQWPSDRIRQVLTDLTMDWVIVDQASAAVARLHSHIPILADCELRQGANLEISVDLEDPMYAIYTSGSTGKPKAAVIPHRGISNRFQWMTGYFGVETAASVLQTTRHVYDSAVWQLLWPLTVGGKTVVFPSGMEMTADNVGALVARGKVTMTDFVPSVFNAIVPRLTTDEQIRSQLRSLRCLIIGGEEISTGSVFAFREHFPAVRIMNVYGPTEASIGCIAYEVTGLERGRIPIGRPIANVKVLILDRQQRLVPVGVPGELCLSGRCLGLGYLNDPERTSQVFVRNPFPELGCDKMYRTGDLARYLPDGQIEFLGRRDQQVKIRGFRVELGEIEAALSRHPLVKQSAVALVEISPGRKMLVAYVTPVNPIPEFPEELKRFVQDRLPVYMVPSRFVILKELPLTPGGKIDKRSLPAPEMSAVTDCYAAPRSATEVAIASIWSEVLREPRVGIRDSFFDLGGNSLLAVTLIDKIRLRFGVEIPISSIFHGATVESMATEITANRRPEEMLPLIPIQPEGTRPPLYCVHPAGGNVLCYRDLSARLGRDQPVYGIQASGINAGELVLASVGDMASNYVNALVEHQPNGPLHLLGYSSGGVVAFEMARQLVERNRDIGLLAIVDTFAQHAGEESPLINLLDERMDIRREDFSRLNESEQACALLKAMNIPEMHHEQGHRLMKVYRANAHAARNFIPQAYPGVITFFRATESAISKDDPTLGWSAVSPSVRLYYLPGPHENLLSGSAVTTLAGRLRELIGCTAVSGGREPQPFPTV